MRRRHGRSRAGVTGLFLAGIAVVATSAPSPAGVPKTRDVGLEIGGSYVWNQFDNDGLGWEQRGTWSVDTPRIDRRGRVHLAVTIEPPPVNPIFSAGPAVLGTTVDVGYGRTDDGGDVGYGRSFGITWTPVAACDADPCTFQAEVTLPTDEARRWLGSIPAIESPRAAVGFTLVRTFGQGAWLQVLPMLSDDAGAGTLARPVASAGGIPSHGVFAAADANGWWRGRPPFLAYGEAVERARLAIGDPSAPVPTVTVRLDMAAHDCDGSERIHLQDAWGAHLFAGPLSSLNASGQLIAVPDGSAWALTHGSIATRQYSGGNVRTEIGTVTTDGQDRVVTATIRCRGVAVPIVEAFTTDPVREPLLPAPTALAWWPIRETYSRQATAAPSVVTHRDDRFLRVEHRPFAGWTVLSSRDGVGWRRVPATTGLDLPDPARLEDVSIGTGGRVTLLLGRERQAGTTGLVAWRTADGRRWERHPIGDRSPSRQAVAASPTLVRAAGQWLVRADATGSPGAVLWSSADGRTWAPLDPAVPIDGVLRSIGPGVGRFVGVFEPVAGGASQAVASVDGVDWALLGALPVQGDVTARLVESHDGMALITDGGETGGPIRAWHSTDDGATWSATLDGWRTVDLSSVSAAGATIAVAARIRNGQRKSSSGAWLTVSRDGGRTWAVQQPPNGHGDGPCTTTVGIGPTALVATVGLCDSHQVWRAPIHQEGTR